MEFLKSIPPWLWALIFIVGLVFVYGIFNRRWLEEEAREKAREAKEQEPPQPSLPHEPVRAASLVAPEAPIPPVEPAEVSPGDDLTLIDGITPRLVAALVEAGIPSFTVLSQTSLERLRGVLAAAGLPGDPTTWPEQAAFAALGDWEGLKTLVAQIKADRKNPRPTA